VHRLSLQSSCIIPRYDAAHTKRQQTNHRTQRTDRLFPQQMKITGDVDKFATQNEFNSCEMKNSKFRKVEFSLKSSVFCAAAIQPRWKFDTPNIPVFCKNFWL
jgi:hypothetical protein